MIQKKKKRTSKALENINKNNTKNKFMLNKKLKNKIKNNNIIYSPKKINRNDNKDSSVLKPETSSLSPSIKSKGTRELSANMQRNKIIMMNRNSNI